MGNNDKHGQPSHDDAASEAGKKNADQRKVIRKAERDPWNRLLSIQLDAEWVMTFCAVHLPNLPIIPNLRCGAWYVPPRASNVHSRGCYFKSTDGHTNEWGFSLKRYNPTVLSLIEQRGGCIIVDSTRRGKSMPDALSKTIPIWCAVINKARMRAAGTGTSKHLGEWNEAAASLCLPKHVVSPSEAAQIQRRIIDWVDDLLESDLIVPQLNRPLRPVFVTRTYMDEGQVEQIRQLQVDYYPVVLVSASPMTPTPNVTPKQHNVGEDSSLSNVLASDVQERRRLASFVYVQGSGDDEEMWSSGLTPSLLWDNENLRCILQTQGDEEALKTSVRTIVVQNALANTTLSEATTDEQDVRIGPMFDIWFGRRSTSFVPSEVELQRYRLIVHCDGAVRSDGEDEEKNLSGSTSCKVMRLGIEHGKRGLYAFRRWIPSVITAAQEVIPGSILICSSEGDGIGFDLNAGMAICILATCFDADKHLLERPNEQERPFLPPTLAKDDVHKRLQWITTFVPQAKAPSRKHMLRINEALLSHQIRAEIEELRRAKNVVQY